MGAARLVGERLVELPGGEVCAEESDGVVVARGLRYAQARRFDPCRPVIAWEGVADGRARGPACPQLPSRLEGVTGRVAAPLAMDEDCLRLSVTAPVPDGASRPVMVWLHGGAYVTGAGEAPAYDTTALTRDGDVVVVAVTYRLGIFGFLGLPGLAPANLGLLDQIAALRWVRDNITAFGGDPSRVTVFGQSAGGDSVLSLLLAESAEGLFQRAVIQSAPLSLRHGRDAMSAAMAAAAMSVLPPDPHDASVVSLLDAQAAAERATQGFGLLAGMPFGPQAGHDPLPPEEEMGPGLDAAASRVELLVGATRDDAAPFLALDPRLQRLLRRRATGPVARRGFTAVATRRLFTGPALKLARRWQRAGGRVQTYRFDWRPAGSPLGACHCLELPFLLGSPQAWRGASMLGATSDETVLSLGPALRRYWAGFAHDGVGSPAERPSYLPPLSRPALPRPR